MRRVPLRRTVALVNHRKKDPVSSELRRYILVRDKVCVMALYDSQHVCRDAYGTPHAAWAVDRLTIEHVKSDLRMGVRAPSDAAHLVALCHGANVGVPSKAARTFFREYLEGVTHV